MSKKKHLLLIDPQRGFAQQVGPTNDPDAAFKIQQERMDGELCVAGGMGALENVAEAIKRHSDRLDDWTITYDCHTEIHIAHPIWYRFFKRPQERFVNIDGVARMVYMNMTVRGTDCMVPAPFTTITTTNGSLVLSIIDQNGKLHGIEHVDCMHPGAAKWTVEYNEKLEAGGRYPHMIWPPHCRIGTPSGTLVDCIREARRHWETTEMGVTHSVSKGSNFKCEHFGAVQAEVVDPEDPTTMPNSHFIKLMADSDQEIGIAGLARGHCLANTAIDLANSFPTPESFFSRLTLLTDGTADVPGLEFLGDNFVKTATAKGMKTATCEEWLSA